jgi:hypothetical protein
VIYLIWIVGIFIVAAGITGASLVIEDLVSNWSHSKKVIEDTEAELQEPNYWRIATLERQLFNCTFHMTFNPPGFCHCDECRYMVHQVDPKASDEFKYGLPSWGDREGE